MAQAKAEASEIVSIATANIEARNSSNEVYAAELQAARASYDAQLGWASTGIDYAKSCAADRWHYAARRTSACRSWL